MQIARLLSYQDVLPHYALQTNHNLLCSVLARGRAPGTFCKVKGHLCKIVSVGTETEMKEKITQLEGDDSEHLQPNKKPCIQKASEARKM